jgi:PadR family transcriptional regulator PadR
LKYSKKVGADMPRHKRGWAIKEGHQREKRRTPLTVALVEPALLLLIDEQPRHGYALLSALEALNIEPIHPSVVYRTLRQMENLGWIESEWDTDNEQGPPRKIFSLTAQGQAAHQTWQEELVKAQDSIKNMLDERK